MREIDEAYLKYPFYGYRRMREHLRRLGYEINKKRVQRLMGLMGLEGIGPKPGTSQRRKEHKVYPYLLRGLKIQSCDEVWCADITYIPMAKGYMYLVAIMDWFSRYVISWEVSNTLETRFCLNALESSLRSANALYLQHRSGQPVYLRCFYVST